LGLAAARDVRQEARLSTRKFDIWIRLPDEDRGKIKAELQKFSERHRISVNTLVVSLLREWLSRKDRTIKLT